MCLPNWELALALFESRNRKVLLRGAILWGGKRLNGSLLTNKEIVWEELVKFRQSRRRRYGPLHDIAPGLPGPASLAGNWEGYWVLGGQIHVVQRVGYRAIQFHPSLHTICASHATWLPLHSILYQFSPPSPAALPPPPRTPSTWPR